MSANGPYSCQLTSNKQAAFEEHFLFTSKTRWLPQRFDLSNLRQMLCFWVGAQVCLALILLFRNPTVGEMGKDLVLPNK